VPDDVDAGDWSSSPEETAVCEPVAVEPAVGVAAVARCTVRKPPATVAATAVIALIVRTRDRARSRASIMSVRSLVVMRTGCADGLTQH